MILAYLDESGNSGNNLTHPDQPIFCLSALLVPAASWVAIEADLFSKIEQFFPSPRPSDFEIHASELINPRGFFRSFPIQHRLDFLNAALSIARHHHLKVIYRAILKRRYLRWLEATFGAGVIINPHLAAFPLVAHVVNNYLKTQPSSPLGIFISDENREIMFDVEKAQKILRGTPGRLHLDRIIEKGFFIDSKKSLLLQLSDLCAYACRRLEEDNAGMPVKEINRGVIEAVKPLLHRGEESLPDVLAWLEAEQKRSGQGPKPRGR
jgi:hypothetical protein